jgi:hypothetical protein
VATDPAAPLYDGVQQLRAIALIENNYIVFDAVRADRPCVIDRYQYGRGEPVTAGALAPAPPDFPGLPHPEFAPIKNVEAGAAGRSTQIRFKDDCTLSLVSEQEFQLCRGLTHGGYRGQPMAVTFARVAAAREASFLAAFTWGNDPPPPQLRIVTNTPTAAELEVRTAARTYVIRIEPPRNTATITARNP